MTADVIDLLAGIEPGSPLDAIRAGRAQARTEAQRSCTVLLKPTDPGDMPLADRFAVATFVAALHGQPEITSFYGEKLEGSMRAALETAAHAGAGKGPYGAYPPGPLSREVVPGPDYRVPAEARSALGPRLTAALEHAHMLVFHPRDAAPARLQALLDAGWSTTGIVTLSQLVSFLAFQIRAVAGLRVLNATLGAPA